MTKLSKLPPSKLATVSLSVGTRQNVADVRITGRRAQQRRWNLWKRDPHCAMCGRFVGYNGDEFEVDHRIPLGAGGTDTEDNLQILCVWFDDEGKHGCHVEKTERDVKDMAGR